MTFSFFRPALVLVSAILFTVSAQAQADGKGPYGLEEAQIKITYEEGAEGPATIELTSEHPIEGDQILLTLSDGRRDHDLRLQRSRDGSFSAEGDLPAGTDLQSLRLGPGDDVGRDAFLMPEVREARDGTLSGAREGTGWKITITINGRGGSVESDGGTTTIKIWW